MNSYKILAIDTSTDACSVALSSHHLVFERFEIAPRAHARLILPMIEQVLLEADLSLSSLDAFAFGAGPGSFTGIRMATSIIQGLCLGVEKPVIPISTLRALAQASIHQQANSKMSKNVIAYLDARQDEVYWGLFALDKKGIMQAISPETISNKQTILMRDEIKASGYPKASDILYLAEAEFELGHVFTIDECKAVYLREEVAKPKD